MYFVPYRSANNLLNKGIEQVVSDQWAGHLVFMIGMRPWRKSAGNNTATTVF